MTNIWRHKSLSQKLKSMAYHIYIIYHMQQNTLCKVYTHYRIIYPTSHTWYCIIFDTLFENPLLSEAHPTKIHVKSEWWYEVFHRNTYMKVRDEEWTNLATPLSGHLILLPARPAAHLDQLPITSSCSNKKSCPPHNLDFALSSSLPFHGGSHPPEFTAHDQRQDLAV